MTEENNSAIEGEIIPADKGGRPSKFKERYLIDVVELMAQGFTDARICAQWDIDASTFYRWKTKNKEFKEAYDRGTQKAQSWWEEFGLAGMTGKLPKFNATIYIAFMNNKFGWSRRDKEDETKTQINIGNLQVLQNLQQLTDKELDFKIQGLISNLGLKDESDGQSTDEGRTSGSTGGESEENEV